MSSRTALAILPEICFNVSMEMIVMKRERCYAHRSLESGGTAHLAGPQEGPHREAPGSVKGGGGGDRGREEDVGKCLSCGFNGKDWARKGDQA